MPIDKLTIAVARGRIFKEALPILSSANIELTEDARNTRKLILPTNCDDINMIVVRSSDVPTYVNHGTADFGIVGRDVLMEQTEGNFYELCDLQISSCRMVVAGKAGYRFDPLQRIRVATKYPLSTRRHFAKRSRQIELTKLNGSIELAPLVGISDIIVDLVDSGRTLKDNGLTEIEEISPISARLIANKALIKIKDTRMRELINLINLANGKKA